MYGTLNILENSLVFIGKKTGEIIPNLPDWLNAYSITKTDSWLFKSQIRTDDGTLYTPEFCIETVDGRQTADILCITTKKMLADNISRRPIDTTNTTKKCVSSPIEIKFEEFCVNTKTADLEAYLKKKVDPHIDDQMIKCALMLGKAILRTTQFCPTLAFYTGDDAYVGMYENPSMNPKAIVKGSSADELIRNICDAVQDIRYEDHDRYMKIYYTLKEYE